MLKYVNNFTNERRNTNMEQIQIRFRHLSWPLKTAVIAAWIALVFMGTGFIIGFIEGLFGVV